MKQLFLFFMVSFILPQHSVAETELPTVPRLLIEKYLGKWYEVARFDHSFQRNCYATTAEYTLREDGDIRVLNTCRKGSPQGELDTAVGRAWVVNEDTNAQLKVQFFLSFWKIPWFAGDYYVIALDENYQYAMVGAPNRKYLWILSRTPNIEADSLEVLLGTAKDLGFDISKLLYTQH